MLKKIVSYDKIETSLWKSLCDDTNQSMYGCTKSGLKYVKIINNYGIALVFTLQNYNQITNNEDSSLNHILKQAYREGYECVSIQNYDYAVENPDNITCKKTKKSFLSKFIIFFYSSILFSLKYF